MLDRQNLPTSLGTDRGSSCRRLQVSPRRSFHLPAPRAHHILWLLVCLLLSLALTSCSTSNDTGSEPQGDQVAPVIVSIEPGNTAGVALDQQIVIHFSEAMDQATAAGNITLSSGTITDLAWQDATTLICSHTAWQEATEVMVTVGTGLTDLAGNPLPRTWNTTFWTYSAQPVLLDSDPVDGATNVLRTVSPRLLFSHQMDLPDLIAATTVTDVVGPDKEAPSWDIEYDGDSWYRLHFVEPLAAMTNYTIQVGSSAHVEGGSEHLANAVSFSFTTGEEVDNTPPTITSGYPTGGNVNPDLTYISITFSEPIDDNDFGPSRMAGQMTTIMTGTPVWNTDRTELTVYVQPPLPAGVRLFAVFPPGTYHDLSGNYNTTTDSISFTVSGTADCFPVNGDWNYYYTTTESHWTGVKDEWTGQLRTNFADIAGNDFTYLINRWDDMEGKWVTNDEQYMRKSTSGVYMLGFHEYDSDTDVMFSPEVLYQKLPFQSGVTWNGAASGAVGAQVMSLTYDGHVLGRRTITSTSPDMGSTILVWENCWQAVLNHEMSSGQQVFESGADTLWYAPAIGIVQEYSGNTNYDGPMPEYYWERRYLERISIGEE